MEIIVNRETGPCPGDAEVEIVERKGLGHEVEALVREELAELPDYSGQLLRRSLGIDRWPLRS